MSTYLFQSARLGFRNWTEADLDALSEINQNDQVMAYFPAKPNREQTLDFIHRMQKQYADRGYCYFALERLGSGELMGFIGICYQTFVAPFTPCTDIGWRLHPRFWGEGYASEGASACLDYAFTQGLQEIVAIAPVANLPSIAVMKRIGMQKKYTFDHPLLLDHADLRECCLYEIKNQKN